MGQKFVIVNTETFSPRGLGKNKVITKADLPEIVKRFLAVNPDPFIVLDESSKIKTTQPCKEADKSTRTRLIKTLNDVGERAALTGTLKSKSPLNVIDQYQFLNKNAFPESMWEAAEKYCIMETIRVGRGRRVLIPPSSSKGYDRSSWRGVRNRLIRAYATGGESRLAYVKANIFNELGISSENLDWIMAHKEYTPFKNLNALTKRLQEYAPTVFISRADAFDPKNIAFEKFINNPIVRKVPLSEEQKKLYNQLVKFGFTDNMVLGKAAALELSTRLLDICNGFEPVLSCVDCNEQEGVLRTTCPMGKECTKPKATYVPLKTNPKLDALMELVDEIDYTENQVVIWSCRISFMHAIAERLEEEGISYCCYSGEQNEAEKEESKARFDSGEARICIANQQSGAYGLNCFKKCDYTIYACSNNSVEQDYQSRHRFLRGATDHPKYAYRLYMEGSVEEKIYASLNLGADLITDKNSRKTFELEA